MAWEKITADDLHTGGPWGQASALVRAGLDIPEEYERRGDVAPARTKLCAAFIKPHHGNYHPHSEFDGLRAEINDFGQRFRRAVILQSIVVAVSVDALVTFLL